MDEIIKASVEQQIQVVLKQGQTFVGTVTPRILADEGVREMICAIPDPQGRRNPTVAKLYFRLDDVACVLIAQEPSAIVRPAIVTQ